MEPITQKDGVIVHRFMLWRDADDHCVALGDNERILRAGSTDEILRQIAEASGSDDDLEMLRARLQRAIERGRRQRYEDELYKKRKEERRRNHG